MNSSTTLKDFQGWRAFSRPQTFPNPFHADVYEEFTLEQLMQSSKPRKRIRVILGARKPYMKNEAVRVFFAVIALILVAMLTSPTGIDSPLNHPVQRRIAALESEAKSKTIRKVIRVKKGKKITVSREDS